MLISKRFARSPLMIGALIGALAVSFLSPVQRAAFASSPPRDFDNYVEDDYLKAGDLDPSAWDHQIWDGWNDFEATNEATWSAVFGNTGTAPSLAYTLAKPVSGGGTYDAVNHLDMPLTVDARIVSEAIREDSAGKELEMGLSFRTVVARLSGPAGEDWIIGTVLEFDHPHQGEVTQLVVSGRLDGDEAKAVQALNSAGGATGGQGGASSSDVEACVTAALAVIAAKLARATAAYAACKSAAHVAKAKALARCAAIAIVPGKGWIGAGICAAAVIAFTVAAKKGCERAYKAELKRIAKDKADALIACGIVVAM